MSLKDRLNAQAKTVINQEFLKEKIKEKIEENSKMPETTPLNIEGLGILDNFFADENLNSVYVSGAKNVYIEKRGIIHKSTSTFRDNVQLINLIKKSAAQAGAEYDESLPYIKFNYREGINVTATLPPLSSVPTMLIKSYYDNNATLKSLQENQAISKELAMVLEALLTTKTNILIAGSPQSLKTTVLSTLSKLLPINNKGILIDFKKEIKIDSNNFVSYDFSSIKKESLKFEILNSIFNSNPDKIIVDDADEKMFDEIIKFASLGFGNIITSINASSVEEAINNSAKIILKQNPNMNFESAKQYVYKVFDIVILCSKDEKGQRKISKISELNSFENKINDIFYMNGNQEYQSSGHVPDFYKFSEFISINPNIFDENYKHTYCQSNSANFQAGSDLIKKFNDSPEAFEANSEEMIKKAQEKFEELKKNAEISKIQKEETNIEVNENTENNEFNLNG